MRYIVIGYGNIGAKRKQVLAGRCVATVDPYNSAADFASVADCPLDLYDAAVLAVPNPLKIDLLEFLLASRKHALVEKPLLFRDTESADRLERMARQQHVIWYTSYNHRFEPHVMALKRLLDEGAVGDVYQVRMFYGNGTAANVAGTWRDDDLGVLGDMASHLIDLTGAVFGRFGTDFVVWKRDGHEVNGIDHCILATSDRKIVIECSFLSWKNRWSIEVVASKGALEMNGLTKWGPSELIVQRRQLPSGVPEESREVVTMPDPTWEADICHFEAMVGSGQTSYENDLWVSRTILRAATAPLN